MKLLLLLGVCVLAQAQNRRLGRFTEVYSWKQLTYNINGNILTRDRATADGLEHGRVKRQWSNNGFNANSDRRRGGNNWQIQFPDDTLEDRTEANFQTRPPNQNVGDRPNKGNLEDGSDDNEFQADRGGQGQLNERSDNFYIRYNNVPMGAERVRDRLFISIPRRRYGIPSTLNYIDLSDRSRSPHLRPYPSLRASRSLTSIYRTRADNCGRLWAVDTGLLELPVNPQQLQQPAIVVFDLQTDRQILRYELTNSDVPANNTPTGLASITVDTSHGCNDAFAYIPDLTTNGIVVFSLRTRDSWRVTHNYFHFNPGAASLNIAGHQFQWSDGIFSIALAPGAGCRAAYFHPLISTQEFAVSTCTLQNRTAAADRDYWTRHVIVGERGPNSQSTMHDVHSSGVALFAVIGADGVACWNTRSPLTPDSFHLLSSDNRLLSYPADLHVTGDEVWVIANTLPRFGYSRLNPNDYNFYIYKANVRDLISGTVCERSTSYPRPLFESSGDVTLVTRINQLPTPSAAGFQSSSFNKYNVE